MMPAFLLPERTASENGQGAPVALDQSHGGPLQFTLGITRVRESHSLDMYVCGSPDGERWKRLVVFRRKSFCGTYSLRLDLAARRDLRFLRAEWEMQGWGQRESQPLFSFYLWAEEIHPKALRAAS